MSSEPSKLDDPVSDAIEHGVWVLAFTRKLAIGLEIGAWCLAALAGVCIYMTVFSAAIEDTNYVVWIFMAHWIGLTAAFLHATKVETEIRSRVLELKLFDRTVEHVSISDINRAVDSVLRVSSP